MNIDEIIKDLNAQIQALEDTKTILTELQEDTREIAARAEMMMEELKR